MASSTIKALIKELTQALETEHVPSRERSLAITNLEQAEMWLDRSQESGQSYESKNIEVSNVVDLDSPEQAVEWLLDNTVKHIADLHYHKVTNGVDARTQQVKINLEKHPTATITLAMSYDMCAGDTSMRYRIEGTLKKQEYGLMDVQYPSGRIS